LKRHEVNHSHPSSAKVKSEWSYTTTPPICLRGAERDSIPLLYVKHFTTVAFEKQDDLNFFTVKYSNGANA